MQIALVAILIINNRMNAETGYADWKLRVRRWMCTQGSLPRGSIIELSFDQ